ncbi:SHOCT domain-containing protein [Streptomyces racemochromogenes]|uniref:SHOCT domain-containing protein n=1 Tax=Streptomyces racemochromogenes TaxID=67353 RepID=A0ABW7PKQ6_9ACTN
MFIRPVNVTVTAATRRPGHPLLRGLLRRAAGAAEWGQDADAAGATGEEALAEAFVEDEDEALAEAAGMEGTDGMEGMDGRAEAVDEADAMARPAPWPTRAPRGSGTAPAAHGSLVSELTQLADLAQEGLLTPEEFTQAKRRLLEG